MSLAWIREGVLEILMQLCYKFLWSEKQERKFFSGFEGKVTIPKAKVGWGLKNPFFFSKTLATKNIWGLIQGKRLWVQIVTAKYISPDTMEKWIKNPRK